MDTENGLRHATRHNWVEGVRLMLENSKYNVYTEDHNYYADFKTTPMMLAACNNNYPILKLLSEHGHREITVSRHLPPS